MGVRRRAACVVRRRRVMRAGAVGGGMPVGPRGFARGTMRVVRARRRRACAGRSRRVIRAGVMGGGMARRGFVRGTMRAVGALRRRICAERSSRAMMGVWRRVGERRGRLSGELGGMSMLADGQDVRADGGLRRWRLPGQLRLHVEHGALQSVSLVRFLSVSVSLGSALTLET